MPNWKELEQTLTRHLNLDRAPVAITFCDGAPAGVRKFDGSVPSGCTFWKVAATAPAGRGAFYTVAADHQNCPIGAHTHNVLQVDGGRMLNEMLGMMAGLGYVKDGRGPTDPTLAADAGRGGLRPARRSPSRARRGHLCVPRVGRDVPGRSRLLRRGGLSDAAAAPPDVHGDSRRRGARGDDVARLHRQSRLHGDPGRSRLHDGARRRPGERRGRSRWHYERQRATHDVSPDPSPDAHQRRSGTSVIIYGSPPSEDAALVLLFTLVASGQIELRRIDG